MKRSASTCQTTGAVKKSVELNIYYVDYEVILRRGFLHFPALLFFTGMHG